MRRAQPFPASREFRHRDSQSNLPLHHLHSRPLPTEEDVASHSLAPSGNLSGNLVILCLLFGNAWIADEPVVVGINARVRVRWTTVGRRRRRRTLLRRNILWRSVAWNASRRRRLKIRRGKGRRVRHSGHFVDNLCTTPPP